MTKPSTAERYGPWALIVGASDGLGADFAREAAKQGLNCALVARRAEKLEELAGELRRDHGVETLCRSIDLMDPDAADRLESIADEVELGLFLVNAGGDTVAKRLLDSEPESWRALIGRNVILLTDTLHRFGRRFVARGRGGLVVVGSDAAFNGAGRTSIYSASKGYALNLMESLWAEVKPKGVDVAFLVIGATDTPKLRGLMKARGVPDDGISLGSTPDIAAWAFAELDQGPTLVYDGDPTSMDALSSTVARRKRVERNTRIIDFFYGDDVGDMLDDLKSGRSWK